MIIIKKYIKLSYENILKYWRSWRACLPLVERMEMHAWRARACMRMFRPARACSIETFGSLRTVLAALHQHGEFCDRTRLDAMYRRMWTRTGRTACRTAALAAVRCGRVRAHPRCCCPACSLPAPDRPGARLKGARGGQAVRGNSAARKVFPTPCSEP